MSVKGKLKEAAGYVKEELNEKDPSAEAQRKAQEGRNLRNEGRVEDGKAPLFTKPGTTGEHKAIPGTTADKAIPGTTAEEKKDDK